MSDSRNLLEEIDSFLATVETTKVAESASTQGHVQNQGDTGTSHPSKSIDDGTQDAPEGARSAENTADVKSSIPGQPVDAAKEDKMEGASENPLTTAKATGEDSANETASASGLIGGEAGKDSSGKDTKHPAKVDFGGKYASATSVEVKAAAVKLLEQINSFNAQVAALNISTEKKASEEPASDPPAEPSPPASPPDEPAPEEKPAEAPPTETKQADAPDPDEEAGKKAAEVAAASLNLTGPGAELIRHMAKEAFDDADRLADFYEGAQAGNEEMARAEQVKSARTEAADICKVIKQAVEDDMAGADAMAFGGEGEEPESAGEGAGAGGEIEQIIAELQQAGIDPSILAQIDPADLAQALAEAGFGGGGGAEEEPPAEAGVEPEMAPAAVM